MLAAIFLEPTLNYNDTLLPENMRPSAAGPVLALFAAIISTVLSSAFQVRKI